MPKVLESVADSPEGITAVWSAGNYFIHLVHKVDSDPVITLDGRLLIRPLDGFSLEEFREFANLVRAAEQAINALEEASDGKDDQGA